MKKQTDLAPEKRTPYPRRAPAKMLIKTDSESMDFEPAVSPPASPTALVWSFAFAEGHLLLPDDEETLTPGPSIDAQVRHYLGRLGGLDAWALQLKTVPHGWRMVPLRQAMMDLPAPHGGLAGRAAQVIEWDRAHRYCGVPRTRDHQRRLARQCPDHGGYLVSPCIFALGASVTGLGNHGRIGPISRAPVVSIKARLSLPIQLRCRVVGRGVLD